MTVSADRALEFGLEQAIENAIVHNPDDSPEVVFRATVDEPSSLAVVRVADDGPPIPEIEIDSIGVDADVSDLSHGLGVGMFAMGWCAESLGGTIGVYDNDPRGNVVEFSIPAVDEAAADR